LRPGAATCGAGKGNKAAAPDDCLNGAARKLARALQALGLVSSRRCRVVGNERLWLPANS
jgi:hypothetical protein